LEEVDFTFSPFYPLSLLSILLSLFLQFYKDFGAQNIFINPFYAGVEAIGDNQVVIGSVGGVVLVTPLQGKGAATT